VAAPIPRSVGMVAGHLPSGSRRTAVACAARAVTVLTLCPIHSQVPEGERKAPPPRPRPCCAQVLLSRRRAKNVHLQTGTIAHVHDEQATANRAPSDSPSETRTGFPGRHIHSPFGQPG
jgi:hypothetical protein